jgi:hypothetical protein
MKRILFAGLAALTLLGCQAIEDQEAMRPLRANGPKLSYDELLVRARRQGDVAMERAFANTWTDVEDVGKALEQTAKRMPDAAPPEKKKGEAIQLWNVLSADAGKLTAAAREIQKLPEPDQKKKQKEIDGLLLNISRTVRTLRAAN